MESLRKIPGFVTEGYILAVGEWVGLMLEGGKEEQWIDGCEPAAGDPGGCGDFL